MKPPVFDYHRPRDGRRGAAGAGRGRPRRQGAGRRPEPGAAAQHAPGRPRAPGRHQPAGRAGRGRPRRRGGPGGRAGPPRQGRARPRGRARPCRCSARRRRHRPPTIRNRGTVVGSIVHADPAAELPAVLVCSAGRWSWPAPATADPRGSPRPTSSSARWSRRCGRASWPWRRRSRGRRPAPAAPGSRWPAATATTPCAGSGCWSTLDGGLRVDGGPGGVHLGRADPGAGRPDRRRRRPAPRRRRLGRRRAAGRARRRPGGRHPRHAPTTAATWSACSPPAPPGRPPPTPPDGWRGRRERALHEILLTVNGVPAHRAGAGPAAAGRLPAPRPGADRHPRRLRARRLRRLHRAARRRPVRSCLLFAVTVDGGRMTTMEGCRSADGGLGPVQQAFLECHGLQCGFCTPGFLTTVTAYLRDDPDPDRRGGPRGDRRQPVPLHRLPEHRGVGAAGRRAPAES